MKRWLKWFNPYHGLLVAFGVLAVVFATLAHELDHEGHFWFHLSVELAVAFALIVVTVVMVERMLEFRREKERHVHWTEVRELTVTSLWSGIVQIGGFAFTLFLPDQQKQLPANKSLLDTVLAGTGNPTNETVQAMEGLAELLTGAIEQTPKNKDLADRLLLWMKPCKPRFEYFRHVIIRLFRK